MTIFRATIAVVISVLVSSAGFAQSVFVYPPAMTDVVNVRDLGAKCDGSTNDTAAIQASVTRANTTRAKAVYFPPSNAACMMGSSVLVPQGVTVYGIPGTVTVKAKAGNTSSPLLFGMSSDTTLMGLTIDGGGTDFGSGNNVTSAWGGAAPRTNIRFINNVFQNTRGVAIVISTSVTNVLVDGNTFRDIGEYWRISNLREDRKQAVAFCCGTAADSFGHIVRNNLFERIGLDAVSVGEAEDIVVEGNVFLLDQHDQLTWPWSGTPPDAFSAAVYCTQTVTYCTVLSNTIMKASGNSIDSLAVRLTAVGNAIADSGQAGINGGASPGTTNTIAHIASNNIMSTGAWAGNTHLGGITLGNSPENNAVYERLTIVANSVEAAADYGIYSFPGSTFTNRWIDTSNNIEGTVSNYLSGGVISGPDLYTEIQSIIGTSGTITRLPGARYLDLMIVGAGGAAGTAISCGAGASCGGPGGGGGGGVYTVYGIAWSTLGVSSCSVSAPAGVAPGGAAAAATTVTCGAKVYQARAGGPGQNGAAGANTGGGGGGTPLGAGGAGSGGTGGAGGTNGGLAGGTGATGAGSSSSELLGSGGGGSGSTGTAGNAGNSHKAPSGGGGGSGCNAGAAVTGGSLGGSIVLGQAAATQPGITTTGFGFIGGSGGGGGGASTGTAGNGGSGGSPGGGAGGAGNACNGTGTPGTSGTSGAGGVVWRQW